MQFAVKPLLVAVNLSGRLWLFEDVREGALSLAVICTFNCVSTPFGVTEQHFRTAVGRQASAMSHFEYSAEIHTLKPGDNPA